MTGMAFADMLVSELLSLQEPAPHGVSSAGAGAEGLRLGYNQCQRRAARRAGCR